MNPWNLETTLLVIAVRSILATLKLFANCNRKLHGGRCYKRSGPVWRFCKIYPFSSLSRLGCRYLRNSYILTNIDDEVGMWIPTIGECLCYRIRCQPIREIKVDGKLLVAIKQE